MYCGISLADPVTRTQCFHFRELGFNPWSGNQDSTCHVVRPEKKKSTMTQSRRSCELPQSQS